VKTHISNILSKLDLKGRMQIVARYYDESIMTDIIDEENKEQS